MAGGNQKDDRLFERLQAPIKHSTDSTLIHSDALLINRSRLPNMIKQEMKLLEATGQRPNKLKQLFIALLSIRPTSVEAEQAFSATGMFATIPQSRLSDKSV